MMRMVSKRQGTATLLKEYKTAANNRFGIMAADNAKLENL